MGWSTVDSASYGLAGPAGCRMKSSPTGSRWLAEAMNKPETREFVEEVGVTVVGGTPEEFTHGSRSMSALWATFPERSGSRTTAASAATRAVCGEVARLLPPLVPAPSDAGSSPRDEIDEPCRP